MKNNLLELVLRDGVPNLMSLSLKLWQGITCVYANFLELITSDKLD